MENRSCILLSQGIGIRRADLKGKRGDYRRAVVAGVLLLFCALRFSAAFFALARCLCQATRLVLFMRYFLSNLFFDFCRIVKINFIHLFGLISTIVILIISNQLIFILMVAP